MTAAVSAARFCSIDMVKVPFSWVGLNHETPLDKGIDDLTHDITRLTELHCLTVKFGATGLRDPDGQEAV
jgi:hypothetical protein